MKKLLIIAPIAVIAMNALLRSVVIDCIRNNGSKTYNVCGHEIKVRTIVSAGRATYAAGVMSGAALAAGALSK